MREKLIIVWAALWACLNASFLPRPVAMAPLSEECASSAAIGTKENPISLFSDDEEAAAGVRSLRLPAPSWTVKLLAHPANARGSASQSHARTQA